MENESIRKETIAAILERNPNAFRPKIANLPPPSPQMPNKMPVSHTSGMLSTMGGLNSNTL